jgi:hypothetical protein
MPGVAGASPLLQFFASQGISRQLRPQSLECQTSAVGLSRELAMTKKSDVPTLIDNPHAPDVFADEATGLFLAGNNVRITFSSYRVDHSAIPGPVNRVVIGRLVLPLVAAEVLHRTLADFLERMKEQAKASSGPVTLQ